MWSVLPIGGAIDFSSPIVHSLLPPWFEVAKSKTTPYFAKSCMHDMHCTGNLSDGHGRLSITKIWIRHHGSHPSVFFWHVGAQETRIIMIQNVLPNNKTESRRSEAPASRIKRVLQPLARQTRLSRRRTRLTVSSKGATTFYNVISWFLLPFPLD